MKSPFINTQDNMLMMMNQRPSTKKIATSSSKNIGDQMTYGEMKRQNHRAIDLAYRIKPQSLIVTPSGKMASKPRTAAVRNNERLPSGAQAIRERIHEEVGDPTAFLAVSEEAPSNHHHQ